ncbi:MAG TPA: methanogenesis marker protein Mmp4/MtxX [Methanothrix sp.]|nr:methanogenesis marker protein Mmp4/MtxX [Methanothrix sp.]HPT18692.1 methanogenesis marker protein Mmp4/MtxX [Methanothrix sp.]
MDSDFIRSLEEGAGSRRARIGIGIWNADGGLIASLQSARRYADLVLVGETGCERLLEGLSCPGFECHPAEEPWTELVRLLAEDEVDGAVRGSLPAGRTMRALADRFSVRVRRLALLEVGGWAFLLGPVGIDEGETAADRLQLLLGGAEFLQRLGVTPRAAVLSGGRMEDVGRCRRVDVSLAEGEEIAEKARSAGVSASHRGILIEGCRGDDIVIAPEGVSGNLIFRTLLLLCGADSYGAPVMMDKIFIDSSRARGSFDGPIMLAAAMAAMKKSK